ncbi:MAG TPA: hypothetical protein VFW10_04295 [Steroidobacteraceae bacterium]|nr:hypothetical protein [Steroidobacteraceae bacterium]
MSSKPRSATTALPGDLTRSARRGCLSMLRDERRRRHRHDRQW